MPRPDLFSPSLSQLSIFASPSTYKRVPFSSPKTKSLLAPASIKAVTLHQEVCLLSFGPLEVAKEYLTISWPVLVAVNSGLPARWPMSWILASGRGAVVENVRRAVGWRAARRIWRENILMVMCFVVLVGLRVVVVGCED